MLSSHNVNKFFHKLVIDAFTFALNKFRLNTIRARKSVAKRTSSAQIKGSVREILPFYYSSVGGTVFALCHDFGLSLANRLNEK